MNRLRFHNNNAVFIIISTIFVIIATTIGKNNVVNSFVIVPTSSCSTTTTTHHAINRINCDSDNIDTKEDDLAVNDSVIQRRTMVRMMMGTFLGGTTVAMTMTKIQPASASYSAYAHREEDWQQRVAQNAVQVTTPKLLRAQLREIAPMNEERSRIFCPNGPSAAVTPLMENRCSDLRMATPSVYGRTEDAVGNSIPGFSEEWTSSIYSSNLPEYGFTKGRK
jgi:hypothetical protein